LKIKFNLKSTVSFRNRHAYNVPIRELIVLVVKAVLDLPLQSATPSTEEKQYLEQINAALTHMIPLLNNYTRSIESQKDCLASIEHFAVCNRNVCTPNVLVRILLKLYEADVLSDDTILTWHRSATAFPTPLTNSTELAAVQQQIRCSKPILKLMDWFEQEQEDSDESD
jgi:hypothetical protein